MLALSKPYKVVIAFCAAEDISLILDLSNVFQISQLNLFGLPKVIRSLIGMFSKTNMHAPIRSRISKMSGSSGSKNWDFARSIAHVVGLDGISGELILRDSKSRRLNSVSEISSLMKFIYLPVIIFEVFMCSPCGRDL